MSRQRLPIALSAAALVVAVLGSTPLGEAARSTVGKVVPFAKNAGAVNGIKASKRPTAGRLLPLGPEGTLPASVLEKTGAYAFVKWPTKEGPILDTTRTSGFVSLTHPGTGVYCLTPAEEIDPAVTAAVVSPDWGNSAGPNNLFAYVDVAGKNCPAGAFEIRTYQYAASSDAKADVKPSDNVSFTVVVP
jgi:hypothetical protein